MAFQVENQFILLGYWKETSIFAVRNLDNPQYLSASGQGLELSLHLDRQNCNLGMADRRIPN
jgi:hypothetical protein